MMFDTVALSLGARFAGDRWGRNSHRYRFAWKAAAAGHLGYMLRRRKYKVGDRVVVGGGYDMDPDWLAGGTGYAGTVTEIVGDHAVVELDAEIVLRRDRGWDDFGQGAASSSGRRPEARGRWLVLTGAYEGHAWRDPIRRVHVGVCSREPSLAVIPEGGGIGIWVESHATMYRARD